MSVHLSYQQDQPLKVDVAQGDGAKVQALAPTYVMSASSCDLAASCTYDQLSGLEHLLLELSNHGQRELRRQVRMLRVELLVDSLFELLLAHVGNDGFLVPATTSERERDVIRLVQQGASVMLQHERVRTRMPGSVNTTRCLPTVSAGSSRKSGT